MSSGILNSQSFATAGSFTFNVPAGVSLVWVTMVGGGGGAPSQTNSNVNSGGGGGSGEGCIAVPYVVTPGGTVAVVVGVKGTGGLTPTNGGATQFGTLTCRGAVSFTVVGSGQSGGGGGIGGSAVARSSSNIRKYEGFGFFGGTSGGNGSDATFGSSEDQLHFRGAAAGSGLGGGGGGSSIFGTGPTGATVGQATANNATESGCGGGGCGQGSGLRNGGDGAAGRVDVFWIG
jgi:hypothetical protein